MHEQKVYCMMHSGKKLTKALADVLLFNACDMFREERRCQRVKGRDYDGVIESNLKVFEFSDVPAVQFEALVSTAEWESNSVRFLVRVDDLDHLELGVGEWATPKSIPIPFNKLPPFIQDKIRSMGLAPDDEDDDVETRFSIE